MFVAAGMGVLDGTLVGVVVEVCVAVLVRVGAGVAVGTGAAVQALRMRSRRNVMVSFVMRGMGSSTGSTPS
jgi:hypothetical protein